MNEDEDGPEDYEDEMVDGLYVAGTIDQAAVAIDVVRRNRKPYLSIRKAAAAAGMSDTRWRQIVAGRVKSGGSSIPVRAPAETLARMARAVGITPTVLAGHGRLDAAEALDEMLEADAARPEIVGLGLDDAAKDLTPEQVQVVLQVIKNMRPD